MGGADGGEPGRRRGRPPAQRGDDTRAAILATAQRMFGAAGYGGVSVEALAAGCGLNPRALYYYFPSKRDLFRAATDDALRRFGAEVASRVFSRKGLRDRVDGYVDVYRHLHRSDPHVVPFVGMVLVDALADDPASRAAPAGGPDDAGAVLRGFLETLVDDALAGDELAPGVDRDGALALLMAIGMGVALASIGTAAPRPEGDGGDGGDSFLAMLDVLQRLNDGTLYRSAGTRPSATGNDTSTASNVTDPPSSGGA
jgi:AcrR family transcriptional regulator